MPCFIHGKVMHKNVIGISTLQWMQIGPAKYVTLTFHKSKFLILIVFLPREKVSYCVVHLALLWITIYRSLVVHKGKLVELDHGKIGIAKLFCNELKYKIFENPK